MVSREILAWGLKWEREWVWGTRVWHVLMSRLITPHDFDCITRLFWNDDDVANDVTWLVFWSLISGSLATRTLSPQCRLGPVLHWMKFRRGSSCLSCSLISCWVEVCRLYFWSCVKPCILPKTTSERKQEPGPWCLLHEWAASRSTRSVVLRSSWGVSILSYPVGKQCDGLDLRIVLFYTLTWVCTVLQMTSVSALMFSELCCSRAGG